MRNILTALTILLAAAVQAQSARMPAAAPYTRLGAYSNNFTDAFSFAANAAALANQKSFTAGLYGERRFGLQDLSYYSVAAALPVNNNSAFAVHGTYMGGALANEMSGSLGYGRKLGSRVDVGAQFNYYSVKQGGAYNNASALTFSTGVLFHLSPNVVAGVHTYNPIGVSFSKLEGESLPAQYSAGIGYEVSDKFFASAEVEKVEGFNVGVHAGMQYAFSKMLFARAGVSTANTNYFLGMGVQLSALRIDATAAIHPQLGVTPGILLIYGGKAKKGVE